MNKETSYQLSPLVSLKEQAKRAEYVCNCIDTNYGHLNENSRISYYRNILRKRAEFPGQGDINDSKYFAELKRAVLEIDQLHFIFRNFDRIVKNNELKGKFNLLAKDAFLPDIHKGSPGRDVQFELFLLGLFANNKLKVEIEEPDIIIDHLGLRIGVAAKRIKSKKKSFIRAKEACKQIKKQLDNNQIDCGIIAFDISNISEKVSDLVIDKPPQSAQILRDKTIEFGMSIGKKLRPSPHQPPLYPIAGIIVYLSTFAIAKEAGHTVTSQRLQFIDLGPPLNPVLVSLNKKLVFDNL